MPLTELNPLSKRIKRQVTGRTRTFFIATAPGLAHLCLKELMGIPLFSGDATAIAGGIEFSGRLKDCYLANLHLRTANRVLMRIGSFYASNFRQLEKGSCNVPWELYLYPGSALKIKVTTTHSRLYHSAAIRERLENIILKRLTKFGLDRPGDVKSYYPQCIHLRGKDDRFMISIDSSGEMLYKRGLKLKRAPAPIRETIAAAILSRAGYNPNTYLLDPMCGSGTFSLEAAMMLKQMPAGYYREFAFMGWPGFEKRKWAYLKREAGKKIKQIPGPRIFASDKDVRSCRTLQNCICQYHLSDCIDVSVADFFKLKQNIRVNRPGLIVMNPPYGRRLGNTKESRRRYAAIGKQLKEDFHGWKLAMIMPKNYPGKMIPLTLRTHLLNHGGLKLKLLEGKIS